MSQPASQYGMNNINMQRAKELEDEGRPSTVVDGNEDIEIFFNDLLMIKLEVKSVHESTRPHTQTTRRVNIQNVLAIVLPQPTARDVVNFLVPDKTLQTDLYHLDEDEDHVVFSYLTTASQVEGSLENSQWVIRNKSSLIDDEMVPG